MERLTKTPHLGDRWPNGVSYGYCHGNLVLEVKFQLGRIDTEGCYLLATFQRQQGVEHIVNSPVWPCEAKLTVGDLLKGHSEQPVLVRVVEIPDHPEQGRQEWVRSLVRLEVLDLGLCNGQDLPESISLDTVLEQVLPICDGKLQTSMIGGACTTPIADCESVNKIIQGRAKTSDAIRSDQGPSIQVGLLADLQENTVLATIGGVISAGAIGSTIIPFAPFTLESIQMFLRPANT